MSNKSVITVVTILSIAAILPLGTSAHAQQVGTTMGQNSQAGMMKNQGHGMGPGAMMKDKGMSGMGQMSMMGRMMKMRKRIMGKMFMVRNKPYSNADTKRMVDGRLAKHGFSKLLAGDVVNGSEKMPKTAVVDIVSPKGEMLFKVEVNRKNGTAMIIE